MRREPRYKSSGLAPSRISVVQSDSPDYTAGALGARLCAFLQGTNPKLPCMMRSGIASSRLIGPLWRESVPPFRRAFRVLDGPLCAKVPGPTDLLIQVLPATRRTCLAR